MPPQHSPAFFSRLFKMPSSAFREVSVDDVKGEARPAERSLFS